MRISKYEKLAEALEGFNRVESLQDKLKINRQRAIFLMYKLRALRYVKTYYGANNKRIYYISKRNKERGISYTSVLNKYAPTAGIRILDNDNYFVHGRDITPEELMIYCLKQNSIRYVIASLILFRKIKDWSLLYKLAKKENAVNKIIALYEVARKSVRKIRKMPKRFYNLARKEKKFYYIVEPYSSRDFGEIEKKWRTYIPLNIADLTEYKEGV